MSEALYPNFNCECTSVNGHRTVVAVDGRTSFMANVNGPLVTRQPERRKGVNLGIKGVEISIP